MSFSSLQKFPRCCSWRRCLGSLSRRTSSRQRRSRHCWGSEDNNTLLKSYLLPSLWAFCEICPSSGHRTLVGVIPGDDVWWSTCSSEDHCWSNGLRKSHHGTEVAILVYAINGCFQKVFLFLVMPSRGDRNLIFTLQLCPALKKCSTLWRGFGPC